MMLWFVMALMTAAAIFAVLWPLARRTPLRSGSDIAVYRDQLDEIERDRAAGLIGGREAEAARIEVSRRLLAADAAAPAPPRDDASRGRRATALAALIPARSASDLFDHDIVSRVTPRVSVGAKRTPQSTAPAAVEARLAEVRQWLSGVVG